ncbi:MAG: hypothetical protein V4596_11810 [Bdellovibrionota bacterium]
MKFLLLAASLILTSCMSLSLDHSTLPQTGAAGRINREMISGEPKSGLREISYKRQFTRSVQGAEDTVRVMLFVDPYLKLNARVQAEDDGKQKGYTQGQIDEEFQRIYVNNMKSWVQTKTCFDFEINSNTKESLNGWDVQLKSVADGATYDVDVKFAKEHLAGKGLLKWFQFTGIMCTKERVEPALGLEMTLTPRYRQNKTIILKWE